MSFRAYEDERLCMDFDSGNVLLDSTPLTMTRKERELLAFLIENRSEIVPRAVLLDRIWGYST